MEKLKRTIGWIPSKEPEIKIDTELIKDKVEKTDSVESEGKKIAIWIKSAIMLNKSALCKQAKIDRSNLDKYIQKGEIPEQHIESIKKIIKKYGYF